MKITDKVSDERLREMFAEARESVADFLDDGAECSALTATENASVYNELLSARTALQIQEAMERRVADDADTWRFNCTCLCESCRALAKTLPTCASVAKRAAT